MGRVDCGSVAAVGRGGASGQVAVATDMETVIRHGLGSEQRVRLGLGLVGIDDKHMAALSDGA